MKTTPLVGAILLVLFLLLFGTSGADAQQNPFFSLPEDAAPRRDSGFLGDSRGGATLPGAPQWLLSLQRELNARLTTFIREMGAATDNPSAWLAVIGASFVYGLMHSFLPGYRKTVIMSYYLSEDAEVLHGVFAGLLFALMHAVLAVAIIAGVYFLVDGALSASVVQVGARVQAVSSGLIMLVGLAFVLVKLRGLQAARRLRAAQRASRDLKLDAKPGAMRTQEQRFRVPRERFLPLVVSTGIVPCPGTTLLLLFTLSLGLLQVGIIAIVSMSLGIAIALSAVAVLTIVFKRNIGGWLERRGGHMFHSGIELAGASFIFLFGLVTMVAFL